MSPDPNKPIILVGHINGDPSDLPEGIVYHPARDADAPRRVSPEVHVSDDANWIEWTRLAHRADLDHRVPIALDQVRSGQWVFSESLDALRNRPNQAAGQLTAIMNEQNAHPMARARAAEILASLGKSEGAQFLLD